MYIINPRVFSLKTFNRPTTRAQRRKEVNMRNSRKKSGLPLVLTEAQKASLPKLKAELAQKLRRCRAGEQGGLIHEYATRLLGIDRFTRGDADPRIRKARSMLIKKDRVETTSHLRDWTANYDS